MDNNHSITSSNIYYLLIFHLYYGSYIVVDDAVVYYGLYIVVDELFLFVWVEGTFAMLVDWHGGGDL